MKVPLYTIKGEEKGTFDLPEEVSKVVENPALLHEVVTAIRANSREVLAHTKTKGEVRGGGKKPWKQKGTGRARHGSSRSPLWVGGGITFGPRPDRNFAKKLNKKTARKALAMVVSDRAVSNHLIVVDQFAFDTLKTKMGASFLKKVAGAKPRALIVLPTDAKDALRCFKNIPNIETVRVDDVNAYEVLQFPHLVMSVDGIGQLVARLKK